MELKTHSHSVDTHTQEKHAFTCTFIATNSLVKTKYYLQYIYSTHVMYVHVHVMLLQVLSREDKLHVHVQTKISTLDHIHNEHITCS